VGRWGWFPYDPRNTDVPPGPTPNAMHEFLQAADVWGPGLGAMVALTVASGFFSGSETALFYLTHEDLRRFLTGTPRQRIVARLLADPDRLLTAILFWNLVVNMSYFAVSVVVAQQLTAANQTVAAGVFGLVGLVGIIVFGEVLPKSVAVVLRRQIAGWVAIPLAVTVRLVDPVIPGLKSTSRALRRTFWPHVVREPHLDTDVLERAVETSDLSDEARARERIVLYNVLDLSELAVEEVMRPRGTYVALPAPIALADLRGEVPPSDYLLVQEERSEEIRGAIPLLRFTRVPLHDLHLAAEEVVFVPWCATAAYTLQLLRDRSCGVACVLNEYGETIGIATYEDLVETVVVPNPSRTRRLLQREPILEIEAGKYHVDGLTTLRYLLRQLEIEYQPHDEGQVTVAGLMVYELEHLPRPGDECSWLGLSFRVFDVQPRGRIRVLVTREKGEVQDAASP
jgi:putative hemolysin